MENTQPCRLLDLPSELRLQIYERVFDVRPHQVRYNKHYTNDEFPSFDYDDYDRFPAGALHLSLITFLTRKWHTRKAEECPFNNFAALLPTCRLINKEASEVLYTQTRLDIQMILSSPHGCFGPWQQYLKRKAGSYRAQLRETPKYFGLLQHTKLTIRFCDWEDLEFAAKAIEAVLLALNPDRKSTAVVLELVKEVADFANYEAEQTWQELIHPLRSIQWTCAPEVRWVVNFQPVLNDCGISRLRDLTQMVRGDLEVHSPSTENQQNSNKL